MGFTFKITMKYPTIAALYSIYLLHRNISTDTRQIKQGDLFFALKGDSFNGNTFAKKAIEHGAAYAIIDEPECYESTNCILVENVLQTLQDLASYHRSFLTIPIIGITGSNGKTTTKELLHAVLAKKFVTSATVGNLNNHIGVPLTLLAIDQSIEMAIVEMGANHQKEIEFLCSIAKPTHGLITNIGKAHLEGFGGFEGVIKTKTELYTSLNKANGVIFYNEDNPILKSYPKTCHVRTYSLHQDSSCKGNNIKADPFVELDIASDSESSHVCSQLIGAYNAENIVAVCCVGIFFNVPLSECANAVKTYLPKNNRSQFVKTSNNSVIVDAYNANPTSMSAAIENFKAMKVDNQMLILGDMLELGVESKTEHQHIVELIKSSGFHHVVLVGPIFLKEKHDFVAFETTQEALDYLQHHPVIGKTILLKGSRGIGLEKLLASL